VQLSAQVRPKAFSNIRIQEPNTFLCAENAMNAQAREGVCHGKEFHRRPESYNINCFSFVLEFCHPNYRIGAPTCANHTVPYGTALLGGAFPGTSCQATIAPSLRDVLPQALARCCGEISASLYLPPERYFQVPAVSPNYTPGPFGAVNRRYTDTRDGAFLHRYPGTSCLATISLSLRDKAIRLSKRLTIILALMGRNPWLSPPAQSGRRFPDVNLCKCPNCRAFGPSDRR